jgi:phosphoadenosine phosphosulfate reductase
LSSIPQHNLPFHPLKEKGYLTVGDIHSSRPATAEDRGNARATRFNGRAEECGLHLDVKVSEGWSNSLLTAHCSLLV